MKEAEDLIRRFEAGADRPDEIVADNVGQHSQADKTPRASPLLAFSRSSLRDSDLLCLAVMDERWMGTEEEEREAYVTELTYIHSKVGRLPTFCSGVL
jgi:phospholipase D1/2